MTDPNEPAFPVTATTGLTKREYFASSALMGLLVAGTTSQAARAALTWADALIAELNKTSDEQHPKAEL